MKQNVIIIICTALQANFALGALEFGSCCPWLCTHTHTHTHTQRMDVHTGHCSMSGFWMCHLTGLWVWSSYWDKLRLRLLLLISNTFWTKTRQNFLWCILLL